MSQIYDLYLTNHKKNVLAGWHWMIAYLPEVFQRDDVDWFEVEDQMRTHDMSKSNRDEYHPYDTYFYGNEKSESVTAEFNFAWLHHIHRNPHHWQYWILVHDDQVEDTVVSMPYNYILEMICDWWSFSWQADNLYEIFDWYDDHKNRIRLHPDTRVTVEDILDKMRKKLEEMDKEEVE